MTAPATINDLRPTAVARIGGNGQGMLTVTEGGSHVPFTIARTFTVSQVPAGAQRGGHAHKAQHQFLLAVQGRIEVVADDGAHQTRITLTPDGDALHVPPGLWLDLTFTEAHSVLMVQCDKPYDEADYLRDRAAFLAWRAACSAPRTAAEGPVRLNVGCGGRPLPGYVNIDMDTLDQIRARYPQTHYPDDLVVEQWNVFDLPCAASSVDEVRADSFVEHLPFVQEPLFFREACRVLRPGGKLIVQVPDFEEVARLWLAAKDDWRDFYRDDAEAIASCHWFGNGSYGLDNRWGYMTAIIYGSQNGAGQFHTNCYSEGKLRAICARLGLTVEAVNRFRWKGDRDPMLELVAVKA